MECFEFPPVERIKVAMSLYEARVLSDFLAAIPDPPFTHRDAPLPLPSAVVAFRDTLAWKVARMDLQASIATEARLSGAARHNSASSDVDRPR